MILLLSLSFAIDNKDLMTSDLPGCSHWNFNSYSGYIPVDKTNKFHYVFLESQDNPGKDPLIVIFSGGPGWSSMNTLFQENGPCVFYGLDSSSFPHDNQYSWNTNASILYVESPLGVGFNIGYQGEENNDELSATLHVNFLENWFEKYPDFKSRDLYLNGESYVGVYVPMLAVYLHQANLTEKAGGFMKLKGIMVGNPLTSWKYDGIPAYIEIAYFHGLIPKDLKESIEENKCEYLGFNQQPLSKIWERNLDLFENYTRAIDPLDIYRKFGDGFSLIKSSKDQNFIQLEYFENLFGASYAEYMNREDVREILHILKEFEHFSPCSDINYKEK